MGEYSYLSPKEIIGDATIGRYNKKPQMRIQFVENVNLALEFIKQRGVGLTNIGAEGKETTRYAKDIVDCRTHLNACSFCCILLDIVDKNLKLILGMLWTVILRFTIADIR